MGDRAGSTFQPYSYDASTAAATPLLQHEGEDESSYNDTVSLSIDICQIDCTFVVWTFDINWLESKQLSSWCQGYSQCSAH